jgi:hypothetical protein
MRRALAICTQAWLSVPSNASTGSLAFGLRKVDASQPQAQRASGTIALSEVVGPDRTT